MKAFCSSRQSEKWVCMPEPWTPARGFGMKLAATPDWRASSFTTWRTRHDRVGHRQSVGVAKIDLVLARGIFVLGVLDADAHLFECEHGVTAQLTRRVVGVEVEVAAVIDAAPGAGRVRGR